jgi:ketosteroid isomerase-like protein
MTQQLTDQLETMIAERSCERLVYQYAWLVDSGEAAGIADLFTADGVWAAGDGEPMRNREGIRAGFAARQAIARRTSRHVMTNVVIDVHSATEAGGRAYLVNYRHDSETGVAEHPAPADAPKYVGEYHLTFRRVDGEWLFATLDLDLAFIRRRAPR